MSDRYRHRDRDKYRDRDRLGRCNKDLIPGQSSTQRRMPSNKCQSEPLRHQTSCFATAAISTYGARSLIGPKCGRRAVEKLVEGGKGRRNLWLHVRSIAYSHPVHLPVVRLRIVCSCAAHGRRPVARRAALLPEPCAQTSSNPEKPTCSRSLPRRSRHGGFHRQ